MIATYSLRHTAIILTTHRLYDTAFGGGKVVSKHWWIQSTDGTKQELKEFYEISKGKKREERTRSNHTYE